MIESASRLGFGPWGKVHPKVGKQFQKRVYGVLGFIERNVGHMGS